MMATIFIKINQNNRLQRARTSGPRARYTGPVHLQGAPVMYAKVRSLRSSDRCVAPVTTTNKCEALAPTGRCQGHLPGGTSATGTTCQ